MANSCCDVNGAEPERLQLQALSTGVALVAMIFGWLAPTFGLQVAAPPALLVAYGAAGEHTWFFKIAGETSLVAEQEPVLLEFLESLEFEAP